MPRDTHGNLHNDIWLMSGDPGWEPCELLDPKVHTSFTHQGSRHWEALVFLPQRFSSQSCHGPLGVHVRPLGSPDLLFWITFSCDGSIHNLGLRAASLALRCPSPTQPDVLFPWASLSLEDSSESPFGHSLLIAHNYPSS